MSEPALLPLQRPQRGERYLSGLVAARRGGNVGGSYVEWYDEESGEVEWGTDSPDAPAEYVFELAHSVEWMGDPDEPWQEWAPIVAGVDWADEYENLCNAMQEAKRSADDRRLDGLRRPLRRKVAAQLQREVRRRWIAALLATVRRRANAVGLVTGTAQVRTRSTGPPPPSAPTSSSSLVRTLTAAPAAPPVSLAA